MTFPSTLTANTTWLINFTINPTYTATNGWTAKVLLKNAGISKAFDLTNIEGGQWQLNQPPTQTKPFGHGKTKYTLFLEKGIDRYIAEEGFVFLKPDPLSINQPEDQRSQNERIYDNICAVLEKRPLKDVQMFKIADREIVKIPIAELQKIKIQYSWAVYREKQRANGQNGVMTIAGFNLS